MSQGVAVCNCLPKTAWPPTYSNGDYSFRVSYNWTGTVTPYKTGFVFSPPSRSYSNLTASLTGQNFIASTGMQISGNVGVGGATLKFIDGVAKSVTSDSNGNYKINISYGWSGTVTPSKTGYIFTPTNRQYFVVTSNLTGQNYTAQLIRFSIAGNAGVGGATLTYFDGITKTVTATSTGFYTVNVPYNWSGKITPSKAGVYSFTPAYRSYTNVTATITGQNYLANYRAAFASSGIYDGQILESAQGSGVGGTMNSTGVNFAVGDDARNAQYRSILSFPTGQLPDTAVIISAKLKLTLNYIFGTNPMTTNGALVIDLAKPVFGTLPNLELVDFNAAANLNQAGTVATTPVNNVYTGNFVNGALPLVNKLGLTQLRLRFTTPSNNDNGSDFMLFYSGEVGS